MVYTQFHLGTLNENSDIWKISIINFFVIIGGQHLCRQKNNFSVPFGKEWHGIRSFYSNVYSLMITQNNCRYLYCRYLYKYICTCRLSFCCAGMLPTDCTSTAGEMVEGRLFRISSAILYTNSQADKNLLSKIVCLMLKNTEWYVANSKC